MQPRRTRKTLYQRSRSYKNEERRRGETTTLFQQHCIVEETEKDFEIRMLLNLKSPSRVFTERRGRRRRHGKAQGRLCLWGLPDGPAAAGRHGVVLRGKLKPRMSKESRSASAGTGAIGTKGAEHAHRGLLARMQTFSEAHQAVRARVRALRDPPFHTSRATLCKTFARTIVCK